MKVRYDPDTLDVINAGSDLATGLAQAGATVTDARNEAAYLELEAQQERINRRREVRDLQREKSRALSRSFALLAAQGGGAGDPSTMAVQAARAGEFGIREHRITADSILRERTLEFKAEQEMDAGVREAGSQIFGGAKKTAQKLKTVFETNKNPKRSGG